MSDIDDFGENCMSTFALRLPDSLYAHAKLLAEQDQASLNQFITVAVAEKVSALQTADFFRSARVSPSPKFWRCFCTRSRHVSLWKVMRKPKFPITPGASGQYFSLNHAHLAAVSYGAMQVAVHQR